MPAAGGAMVTAAARVRCPHAVACRALAEEASSGWFLETIEAAPSFSANPCHVRYVANIGEKVASTMLELNINQLALATRAQATRPRCIARKDRR